MLDMLEKPIWSTLASSKKFYDQICNYKELLKENSLCKRKIKFHANNTKKKKKSSNIDNQFIIKCKETWR